MSRPHANPASNLPALIAGPVGLIGAVFLGGCMTPYLAIMRDLTLGWRHDLPIEGVILGLLLGLAGASAVAATLVAFTTRGPGGLRLLRSACWILAVCGLACLIVALQANAVLAGVPNRPSPDMAAFWRGLHAVLAFLLLAATLVLAWYGTRTIQARVAFHDPGACMEEPGDRFFENLRTFGPDPRFRRSWVTSAVVHILVLFGPLLLITRGCGEAYPLPPHSGRDRIQNTQFRVVIRHRKHIKPVMNPNSPIAMAFPEWTPTEEEVEVQTSEVQHDRISGQPGKLGTGGGDKGGWQGKDGGLVRFIRLRYDCPEWDDGVDTPNQGWADRNFLRWFRDHSGVSAVAPRGEVRSIEELDAFIAGGKPPFVYMTGEGPFALAERQRRILRDYCLRDCGMIFADCGSPAWGQSFRREIAAILGPGRMLPISDDDPLFRGPNPFPNGADPLSAHDGIRALGVKHQGRWVVFYHPGDLNDGWKTPSNYRPGMRDQALALGMNVVSCALGQMGEINRSQRKR